MAHAYCLSLYLAHAYRDSANAYFDLGHAYSSIYYIPIWISVMGIWHMRNFPSLKKRISQGPAVYQNWSKHLVVATMFQNQIPFLFHKKLMQSLGLPFIIYLFL